jgi:hypothetical protein
MVSAAAARSATPSSAPGALFGLFAVFQVLDFLTTNYALAHPAFGELNIAMAWCFSSLGVFGLTFAKVVLLGFTALAANAIPRWSLTLVVLISGMAAANNILHVAPVLAA